AEAWAGETIYSQLAVWTKDMKFDNSTIELSVSDLKSNKNRITKNNIQFAPIAYVISDDPSKLKSACGINVILDSTLVADRILNSTTYTINSKETRPLWLSGTVPQDAKPGIYKGEVNVKVTSSNQTKKIRVPYKMNASEHKSH